MNAYELIEKVEGEQFAVIVQVAPNDFSVTRRKHSITAMNFESSFKSLALKFLTQFVTENYPNTTLYSSADNAIFFRSDNKDCMKKIAKIFMSMQEQVSESYNEQLNSKFIVGSNAFDKILEPYFAYAILNDALSINSSSMKKRKKI